MEETIFVLLALLLAALIAGPIFFGGRGKPAPVDRACVIARYDVCVQAGEHPSLCANFANEVCR